MFRISVKIQHADLQTRTPRSFPSTSSESKQRLHSKSNWTVLTNTSSALCFRKLAHSCRREAAKADDATSPFVSTTPLASSAEVPSGRPSGRPIPTSSNGMSSSLVFSVICSIVTTLAGTVIALEHIYALYAEAKVGVYPAAWRAWKKTQKNTLGVQRLTSLPCIFPGT